MCTQIQWTVAELTLPVILSTLNGMCLFYSSDTLANNGFYMQGTSTLG